MKRVKEGAVRLPTKARLHNSKLATSEERFCVTCNSMITQGECKATCWEDAQRLGSGKHVRA